MKQGCRDSEVKATKDPVDCREDVHDIFFVNPLDRASARSSARGSELDIPLSTEQCWSEAEVETLGPPHANARVSARASLTASVNVNKKSMGICSICLFLVTTVAGVIITSMTESVELLITESQASDI